MILAGVMASTVGSERIGHPEVKQFDIRGRKTAIVNYPARKSQEFTEYGRGTGTAPALQAPGTGRRLWAGIAAV
jgi:hypothetical protein